MVARFDFFT